MRSVGASLGAQVSAAVLAGSVVAGGLPTNAGYTAAFLVSAGVALLAAVTAFLIPSRRGRIAAVPVHARHDRGRRAHARRRRPQPRARRRGRREVFAEKGEAASIPEIAARAGVGKGTVYRCFPTKDHLVAAVASERVRWFEREAREAAPQRRPLERVPGVHGARSRTPTASDRGMVASMSQSIELTELLEARADAHDALRRADGPRDRPGLDARRRRARPT